MFAMDTVTLQVAGLPLPKQTDIGNVVVDYRSGVVFWSNSVESTVMKASLDGAMGSTVKTFDSGIKGSVTLFFVVHCLFLIVLQEELLEL